MAIRQHVLRSDFVKGGGRMYGVDDPETHALALHHGLALLGPHFVCEVCMMCGGRTRPERPNHYGGFSCDWCRGTGLTQGYGAAPAFDSQRHQVLIAASLSLLIADVNVL